jgi:hypothetical protein
MTRETGCMCVRAAGVRRLECSARVSADAGARATSRPRVVPPKASGSRLGFVEDDSCLSAPSIVNGDHVESTRRAGASPPRRLLATAGCPARRGESGRGPCARVMYRVFPSSSPHAKFAGNSGARIVPRCLPSGEMIQTRWCRRRSCWRRRVAIATAPATARRIGSCLLDIGSPGMGSGGSSTAPSRGSGLGGWALTPRPYEISRSPGRAVAAAPGCVGRAIRCDRAIRRRRRSQRALVTLM